MPSIDGIMIALNLATLWLLVDAYGRPPRGYHGPPWYRALIWTVIVFNIVLTVINVTLWVGRMYVKT